MIVTIEDEKQGAMRYTRMPDGNWQVEYRMDDKWYPRNPPTDTVNMASMEIQRIMRGQDYIGGTLEPWPLPVEPSSSLTETPSP